MRAESLVEILGRRAATQPDRRAYTFLLDGETEEAHLTYGELDLRARAVAARLRELGLAGERALLVYPSGLDYLAGFFGCLYAGVVAVPAYPPRLNRSLGRLQAIVLDARVAAALSTADLLDGLAPRLAAAPDLAALPWVATDALEGAEPRDWRPPSPDPSALALLQYTSSSTAAPKGVMVCHGNLLHNQAMIRRAFPQPDDAVGLGWLPPYHDMGLIGQVLQPLYAGFPCVFLAPAAFLQKPARWLQALSRYRATGSGAPNFGYELCVEKVTAEQKRELDLGRWSLAFNGAEPIRPETLERFSAAFAACGFRREAFYPCYGLAEATLIVSGAKRRGDAPAVVPAPDGDGPARRLAGSGRILTEQRVAIVDPDSAAGPSELPAGQVGEIWVSGGSVAQGYWGREEESAETFGARLADGDGPFLRTGDLGFVVDGELFVTGRTKDLIIVRGRNHYPHDVEWTVERSHPDLLPGGGAAFSVPAGGEERLVVVQEVHRHRRRGLDPAQVAAAVRRAVTEAHEIAAHAVVLVQPFTLPKTSSGKIQRHLCRAAYLAGSLEVVGEWREENDATLRAWLVERLAEQLRIEPHGIDVRAPFAALGLDSARLVGLSGELETRLGRRLDPTLLYEHPTIEALARYLTGGEAEPRAAGPESGRGSAFAVVGMACRFPGADGLEAFRRLLCEGVDAVTEVPDERRALTGWPASSGVRWGGFLSGVERFDPAFFGLGGREAAQVDPQQRLLLEVAWEALEDAGRPEQAAGSRTGVFVGISTYDYGRLQPADPAAIDAYGGPGCALSVAANRLSYAFDLHGPSLAVDTACSSSLVALHLACRALEEGECGVALVGGVNLMLLPDVGVSYARAGNLAADGRCKAFDARADGFVRGEGAGSVVLKPLDRALADGDRVYAVVRGTAVNQDGRTNGLMAPSPRAQEEVLRQALRRAGVAPGDVQYVEAHGTGTLLGDPVEAKALGRVLAEGRPAGRACALGSVKTNLGHLEAAAGMAGLIKTALALHHREIPPSLHFEEPNPHIPFGELPLVVQRELTPWPEGPRLAGVSAFGFGGTNAHAVLAGAPEEADRAPAPPPYLVPLSAHTPEALTARARSLLDPAFPLPAMADLAFTAGRRSHHRHRLAVLTHDGAGLRSGLGAFLRGEPHPGLAAGQAAEETRGPVFVLSGQGGQHAGMGLALAAREPVFRDTLQRCDRLVAAAAGWSLLAELAVPAERSRLLETAVAQPALLALQVALASLWRSWGVEPAAVVGHSAGEVGAAWLAGVLTLEEAVRLAVARGRLLERAAAGGRMAQVELSEEEAREAIGDFADRLSLAAVNAPRSVVVTGDPDALDALRSRLEARQVFCRVLAPAYAFHSPRIEPFLDGFEAALAGLAPRSARVPLVSTLTGSAAGGGEWDAAYWRRQARRPVRFADAVTTLLAQGHRRFLEIGPHPVLSAALSECFRHDPASAHASAHASLRRGEPEPDTLLRALGGLYVQGVPAAWGRVHAGGRPVALPAYPWQRERCWLDESASHRESRREAGGHPLLGPPLQLARPRRQWVWETALGPGHLPFLADHRVEGAMVVPAAAWLEMAVAASAQATGKLPGALADVRFASPLVLPESGSRRVQVVLAHEENEEETFEVFSRPEEPAASWTLHAEGKVRPANGDLRPESVDLDEVRRRCPEGLAGSDLYARFAAQGLGYGDRFQGIATLWRGEREALGEVTLPESLLPELSDYHVHPAVLDACGQVMAAAVALDDEGRARPLVPVSLEELRLHDRPGQRLWSHAWRRPEGNGTLLGDGRLLDGTGRVLLEARGMRLRALDGAGLRRESPADWLYELKWEPVSLPAPPLTTAPGAWLVFADGEGVGEALASRLSAQGDRCAVVAAGPAWEELSGGRFRLRPGEAEDVRRLLDHLVAAGWPALRGVVHLWSLDTAPAGETTTASLEAADGRGCGAVLPLVQEILLRAGPTPPRLWLVTRGGQPVGPEPVAAAQAPLWGFGRSLAQEHPALWGGLVDLDPAEEAAESVARLAGQIPTAGPESQIAWRGGVPHGARLGRRRDLLDDGPAPRRRPDATYLVTGGLGGLGLEVARFLVERGARRLILLGRTRLPPRRTWSGLDPESRAGRQASALRGLEARGAAVHLAAVDVADEAQLALFLDGFRDEGWPPIRGVVHAAGVLQDQAVLQLDAAALAAVFRAKVLGAWLLHRLLDREPLEFFVLFSSAAALLGSAGQAHYAAANAFLDALAHLRRGEGKPASSLAWGPWAEVGLAAAGGRGERLARRGLGSIPPEQGLEVLERLLVRAPVHVGIVPVDWERLLAALPALREAPLLRGVLDRETARARENGGALLAALQAAPPAERLPRLQALLAEQVGSIVGLPAAQLDLRRPLNDLGVDSLMAAELKGRVERELGISVPIVRLLENPSLGDFARVVMEHLGGAVETGPSAEARPRLAALQPEGSRTPFFCVHPGALEVQCYESLVTALGRDQPFYVLQPPFDLAWEDAEDQCIETLREVQPAGPYLLGGWSMGGVLAWSVGRRLAAQGEEVARLVLLDSPAPPSEGEAPDDYDDDRLLPVFARYLGARQGRELTAPNGGTGDRLQRLLQRAVEAGAVPPGCDEEQLASLLQVFKAGLLRSVRQLWACRPETAETVPFPITLLRPLQVLDALAEFFPNPEDRWRALTSGGLEVRRVAGDHYTLFLPDHAAELARELERSLARPA